MALSPPKASRAGLRARQAAKRDTAASTIIQAIVTVCTRLIRRIASGEAVCSTEAIHDIMAPHSHGLRSGSRLPVAGGCGRIDLEIVNHVFAGAAPFDDCHAHGGY